ncbi:MAG: hypothetical protein IJT73_04555 [Selenomonadaceae bacterium]|nr:hypothetical protein [Selenomonadaceae bacterium]
MQDLYGRSYLYVDSRRDLIVAYFIKNKIDNAALLNETLKYFNLRDLSGQKNLSEVEVYKSAHLDRRIFSKLRNDKNYNPSKYTILAVALGMKLNLEETLTLLQKGGYALSEYSKFDLINEVLDYYEFKPLGG